MTDKLICQICHINESLGVAASRLGPYSCAMCRPCVEHNAEPEFMVKAVLFGCGGWANVHPEIAATITVFKNGKYELASKVVPDPTPEEIAEYLKA